MKGSLLFLLVCLSGFTFARAGIHSSIIHVTKKGETLYGIAKKYGTTEMGLKALNPYLRTHQLFVGEKLKIPSGSEKSGYAQSAPKEKQSMQSVAVKNSTGNATSKKQPVFHTVSKGETLFSLSKKYKTQVDSIMAWNHLKKPGITIGLRLVVGFQYEQAFASKNSSATDPAPVKTDPVNIPSQNTPPMNPSGTAMADAGGNTGQEMAIHSAPKTSANPTYDYHVSANGNITERGSADWIVNDDDSSDLYLLHRTAPIGTIINVTNLANHKTVAAKVVGKLPGSSLNEPVLILVSDGVARALGVSVEKFDVEINYTPAREQ